MTKVYDLQGLSCIDRLVRLSHYRRRAFAQWPQSRVDTVVSSRAHAPVSCAPESGRHIVTFHVTPDAVEKLIELGSLKETKRSDSEWIAGAIIGLATTAACAARNAGSKRDLTRANSGLETMKGLQTSSRGRRGGSQPLPLQANRLAV
jgi:hypothetical protein